MWLPDSNVSHYLLRNEEIDFDEFTFNYISFYLFFYFDPFREAR